MLLLITIPEEATCLDVWWLLYSPRPPLGLVAVEMVTITFVLPSLPPPSARLMEAGGLLWAEYFCNAGDTSLPQILIHLGSAHPEEGRCVGDLRSSILNLGS